MNTPLKKYLRTSTQRWGQIPLIWYLMFLVGPLALVFFTSFLSRGPYGGLVWRFQFDNYLRVFDSIYILIVWRSFLLALSTSAICAALGLPIAWTLATAQPRKRNILLFLVVLPFLTNLIIRIYSLKLFLSIDGPLVWVLEKLKIEFDPYALSANLPLVIFGMITTYLPFMIFPLYTSFQKYDDALIEAAQDLGANWKQIIFKVILPLMRAPLLSGFLMVFIPALGEFLIPDLLGGAKVMLIGNLITEQFLKARDWPFGSALTAILIFVIAGFSLVLNRLERGSRG